MAAKLKTKITLGVVFLFTLLLLVGSTGLFYLNKTTAEQHDILKDNYETIGYTQNMLKALDEKNFDSAKAKFEKNLIEQEGNITEEGEGIATKNLRTNFSIYTLHTDSTKLLVDVRNSINSIMQINLNAILKKNEAVQKNADDAKFIITALLTICVLIGFTFVYNFPGFIANPIAKLTEGIKAIANKQYKQRIHLNRTDEFGEMANAFNNMAEELDKYEHSNLAKILFEKQRAETVINSLKDASIGIDTNGIILFANQQALQLLSINDTDAIGKKQEAVAKNNDLFNFLLGEESNSPFKIIVNGKEEFFIKEMVEIKNMDGIIGNVIILKNITPFKELDVAKTNFIATISHELKTPLASSDFSLKLLEDSRIGNLNKEQKELIQNIKDDNKRLLKILSELLDLSQVESGKIQLNIQPVNVENIVQRAIEAIERSAKDKNISIAIDVENNLPTIHADAEKTSWVLINFLTNAIKYSKDNSTILLQVKQVENKVKFNVIDKGIGIAPEYLYKIFDRFFKVPNTTKKGSGLGLAISKEFIEAMGGQISAESILEEGSTFSFSLNK